MVSHILRTLTLILLPAIVWGQSLDLSVMSPTANNNTSTFLLDDGEIEISRTRIRFFASGTALSGYEALGISPDHSIVSVLQREGKKGKVTILNSRGDKLNSFATISLGNDDPSIAVYPAGNGGLLLRDNVANFTFYDETGDITSSMSSSSQSKEGEKISEVAVSDDHKTIVIYSPKIKRDNQFGSFAKLVTPQGETKDIFYSSDRYLKKVEISDNGNILVALTAKAGSGDKAIVMDRFGNELNSIETDENLVGASFSADNEYITLYSGGRVMVYSTTSGERLGATSFRSPVFLADYFPADNLILALTGSYSERNGILRSVKFRAINLKKRSITSKKYNAPLGFTKALDAKFKRVASNTYQLQGGNKSIKIEANF